MFNFTPCIKYRLPVKYFYWCAFLLIVMQNFAFAQAIDPTKPLSGTYQASKILNKNQHLQLESIIHNGNVVIVIINGTQITLNEYIHEYQLVEIKERSVVLRSPLKQLELSLFSPVIKK